ncbi:MAG: hypothetical protein M1821_006150 [Bathelium mastoideum]|nr:MAG: hypothetical protein M1821_006150 [Bathelium mastoideum]
MDPHASPGGVALQHPTPDLHSLQGAYMGNVERLEHEAERLSSGGSDLADNIRKLKAEQKLSESRRASLRSAPTPAEEGRPFPFNRSRNASTSSYSNSIVDVNSAARWGGYSPGGYVTSPVGSLRSGSYSHRSNQVVRSTSRTSRLTQLPEPEQEGRPLDSPLIASPVPTIAPPQPPDTRSFSREYENMAQEIRDQLDSISPEHDEETKAEDQDTMERYEDMAHEIHKQLDWISPEHGEEADESKVDDVRKESQSTEDEELIEHEEEPSEELHPELILNEGEDLPLADLESNDPAAETTHDGTAAVEDSALTDEHSDNQDGALMPPDRPATAASTDTYQQARMLFQDFDGVHYAPSIRARDEELEDDDVPSLRNHPLTRSDLARPPTYIEPPPSDDMVFYPAPVPRTLNLPKRLSQLPTSSVQAKRRSQVLGALPADVRKSAVWLPEPESEVEKRSERPSSQDTNHRLSREKMDLAALPPQLRASAYFEHQSVPQEVEVKGESAVATLDSILEASATAPVGAFTNHPISGASGRKVFGKESARRSTTSILDKASPEKKKNRSTLDLLLGRRKSSGDPKQLMQKQNGSRLSIGTQLNDVEANEGDPLNGDGEEGPDEPHDEDDELEEESEEQFFGPPSTLLAELQLRKHQQKLRSRTAATAFPNGMHSTLLELDAVAQIEKKRRMAQRLALAWEDSEARAAEGAEADDDDVPLGMLFPGRDGLVNKARGLSDWDRPLGLLEKRDLEENEPLSRRRNRLRGVSPNKRDVSPAKRMPDIVVKEEAPEVQPPEPEDGEDEDEPLAQRLRRLKNRETLNSALGDVAQRPLSSDFASEIMSQLGGLDDQKDKDKNSPNLAASPANEVAEEEETLGQRRKRLQAEALANGTARNISGGSAPSQPPNAAPSAARPNLKPTRSLADLLAANPLGSRQSSAEQPAPKTAPPPVGSLLHRADHRAERRRTRQPDGPLVDVAPPAQAVGGRGGQGAFAGGAYNNGAGGAAASTPGVGYGGVQGGMQGAVGGVGMGGAGVGAMGGGMGKGMGMMTAPVGVGMGTPMGMNMNMGMGMNMPMGVGAGMGLGYPSGVNGYFGNMAMQNHPLGYGNFHQPMGVDVNAGMGMAGFAGQYGYGQNGAMAPPAVSDIGLNQKQRDMIDRWRQSIAFDIKHVALIQSQKGSVQIRFSNSGTTTPGAVIIVVAEDEPDYVGLMPSDIYQKCCGDLRGKQTLVAKIPLWMQPLMVNLQDLDKAISNLWDAAYDKPYQNPTNKTILHHFQTKLLRTPMIAGYDHWQVVLYELWEKITATNRQAARGSTC